jgi:hypothetical protein
VQSAPQPIIPQAEFVYPNISIPTVFDNVTNRHFHDITDLTPSKEVELALSLSKSFIFEPPDIPDQEVRRSIDTFERKVRIKTFFEDDKKEYAGDARLLFL